MSASKRARILQPTNNEAPAHLVSEIFDCLIHCSRSQLSPLLKILVKSSSSDTLVKIRDEAVKNGTLIKSNSLIQRCVDWMLNAVFGFLDRSDLRQTEVT